MTVRLSLLLVALALCAAPAGAQEAFLFGFRVQEAARRALPGSTGADSLQQAGYRTLLVYPEANGRYRAQAGAGLLVPTARGVVQVGAKRSRYNNWGEDFVWTARAGQVPEYRGIDAYNGEYCSGFRKQHIVFAGPRYLALETSTAGYCEGSASPWNFNTLAFLPLDSLAEDGLDIAAVLGRAGEEALARGASDFLRRLPSARRDQYLPEADPANWAVVRRTGRWVLTGRLEPIEMSGGRGVADFEIPLPPPSSVVGPQGEIAWAAVQAVTRDAQDAFASPSGKLVAIRRPGLITVHTVSGRRIGPALLGHPLPDGAVTVLVQWIDPRMTTTVQRTLRGRR